MLPTAKRRTTASFAFRFHVTDAEGWAALKLLRRGASEVNATRLDGKRRRVTLKGRYGRDNPHAPRRGSGNRNTWQVCPKWAAQYFDVYVTEDRVLAPYQCYGGEYVLSHTGRHFVQEGSSEGVETARLQAEAEALRLSLIKNYRACAFCRAA